MKETTSILICVFWSLAALAGFDSDSGVPVETFDLVEVNETWVGHSETPLRQLLVYSWNEDLGKFLLDDFALLDRDVPVREHPGGGYFVHISRNGVLREIRAACAESGRGSLERNSF